MVKHLDALANLNETISSFYFRCPTYTSLPSFCKLVKLENECCSRPKCNVVSGTPGTIITTTALPTRPTCAWCQDTLDNCKAYGQAACQAPYVPWAKRNCAHHCNFCGKA